MKECLLIVDDQEVNRYILGEIFKEDYEILQAKDGKEAIETVAKEKAHIVGILLDIVMPQIDGFEVLRILNEKGYIKRIPVVMITGDTSVSVEEKGFDNGIADFITKPFNHKIVYKRVKNVIDLFLHKNKLEYLVRLQTNKITEQADVMKNSQEQVITLLSSIVEFRSMESGEHIKRIRKFTNTLAKCLIKYHKEYNLSEDQAGKIVVASMMHDIGKIAIPDKILLKPGKLTPDEFEVMKTHTLKGCEMMDKLSFIDDKVFFEYCYNICRYHHEKYDGKGYPDGLSGDEIPIEAQIVSIADCYDALVSERVYKKAYTPEEAYDMILAGECGAFNPKLIECFIMCRVDFEKMTDTEVNSES